MNSLIPILIPAISNCTNFDLLLGEGGPDSSFQNEQQFIRTHGILRQYLDHATVNNLAKSAAEKCLNDKQNIKNAIDLFFRAGEINRACTTLTLRLSTLVADYGQVHILTFVY